jgi:hypothetical protein
MCSICIPILGSGGLPHTEEMCAVKQSAYCPVCGPSTHFPSRCPKKGKPLCPRAEAIPSLTPAPLPPYIVLADTNETYVEYIKHFGLEISRKQCDNKATVADHLESRDTPTVLVNPPVSRPSLPAEKAHCGHSHGQNEHCIPRPKIVARPKKNTQ